MNKSLSDLKSYNYGYHSEGNLFYCKNRMYKIFKKDNERIIENKQNKIDCLLTQNKLENVVMPDKKIYRKGKFIGYEMEYMTDMVPLYDLYVFRKNLGEIINLFYRISLALRDIHNDDRNIIVSDLNDANIIIDRNLDFRIVDFDSAQIGKYAADTIYKKVYTYYLKRKGLNFVLSKNMDKLSLIFVFLSLIGIRDIDDINIEEYDNLFLKGKTLENLRDIILDLKDVQTVLNELPYFDELVFTHDFDNKILVKKEI